MAVKDWHPGQLVIFWVVLALVGFSAFLVGFVIAEAAGNGALIGEIAGLGVVLLLVALLVVALTVSWHWFGARKSN